MATRTFTVVLDWDPSDHVWVSYVPALNGLSTYGDTREEALDQTREAIAGYLEAAAKEGMSIADAEPKTELVRVEVAV